MRYMDNIEYGQRKQEGIDSLLARLLDAVAIDADAEEAYAAIHARILRSIRLDELAITTIMPDLLALLDAAPRKAELLMRLLADPYASYSDLGAEMGYSKQRVGAVLSGLAARYPWLARLLAVRGGQG